jgi:glycosyltransferase involved in cell wall biosynthesis
VNRHSRLRAIFFMEQLPGQSVQAINLERLARSDPDLDAEWVTLSPEMGAVQRAADVQSALVRSRAEAVFFNSAPAAAARALRRVPTTISLGIEPERAGRGPVALLKDRVHQTVLRQAKSLAPWTEWTAGRLTRRYRLSAGRIHVVPPGVDLELWRPAARPRGSGTRPQVLFVASQFRERGGDLLLDWFLSRGRRHCHLVMVSGAPEALDAQEHGVEVHADLGPDSVGLRRLYRESDVFALPSRIEGFSLPAVEALATGLPVVTTDLGCLPEIVTQGVSGRLVPPDDRPAFEAALEGLMADPLARRTMGTAGRRQAEERFDAARNGQRLLQIVKTTASRTWHPQFVPSPRLRGHGQGGG